MTLPPRETERSPRDDRDPRDLREAAVAQAAEIVARDGLEALSLREVARRLGVSHQAPYKHFPSRDHLLAEVVRRAFVAFARALDERPRHDDARADMAELGRAYLAYARSRPEAYRLMFGAALPDPQAHPEMMREARHAFETLRAALLRVARTSGVEPEPAAIDLDALFVWSCVHGLASILETRAGATLGLADATTAAAEAHVLRRIGPALGLPEP